MACALLAFSAWACAGAEDPSIAPVRGDSSGVALVDNPPADRVLEWTFGPILSLGGVDDGPAAFFRVFPTSIGVDSLGHLYVLDAGNFTVSVFDRSGGHLRSFGRQGQGPGELGFPSDMAVTRSGEAAVYDFARRALVLFDAHGAFTRTLALPGPLQRQVTLREDGTVVAAVTQAAATADSTDYRLLALNGDTVEIAQIRQFSHPQPRESSCGSVAVPPYLGPRIVWAAAGDRIVFSDDVSYAVRIVDDRRLVGTWRRALPLIRSTLAIAAREVGRGDSLRFPGGCAIPAEDAARLFGFHDIAPMIQELAVAPDGVTWVRRRTNVPGESRIDVLDATGAYLGTLPADSPFPALFRGRDEIVTVERDDLGRPLVVVHRIHRGS